MRIWISLRVKLIVAFLGVVGLTLILVAVVVDSALQRDHLHAKEVALLTQANIISNILDKSLWQSPVLMRRTIRDFGQEIDARIVVTDHKGLVIADVYSDPRLLGQIINIAEVRAALEGRQEAGNRLLQDGTWTMYAAVPIVGENGLLGSLLISQSLEDVSQIIAAYRWRLGAAIGLTALAGTSVSFIFASALTRRIGHLTDAVQDIGEGNYKGHLKVSGKDEVGLLSHSFNVMGQRLKKAEDDRRQFFSDAAHELRTPVSAIKALVEPLAFGKLQPAELYKEFCHDVYEQADRLVVLVDGLLHLSTLDDGWTTEKKTVNVNDVVEDVLRQIAPLARQKDIELTYQGQDIYVSMDKQQMAHALLNILHNAVKYTPKDGKILFSTQKGEGEVHLSIVDTGIGIPEEAQLQIFERFYRVDKSRARDQGGTGLGLAIVKRIVDLHQGRIELKSVEGKGTEVIIRLPEA